MFRARSAILYIWSEMLPVFLVGLGAFVGILLMFQALRLTEFLLVHGVKYQTIGQMVLYLSVSFLPAILPMSLLFSVLFTYGRLSSDSEIVAMKSIGLNMKHIGSPAVVLAILVSIISAQISFHIAPWGNRQFEVLIAQLGQSKASATIREGIFSEGFFDLVVYANKVDSKKGLLSDVFIYDERDSKLPMTIIAKKGEILTKEDKFSRSSSIRLIDGNIHRASDDAYTKVDFKTYDINLEDPIDQVYRKKSLFSLTLPELAKNILTEKDTRRLNRFKAEYHKRWALAFACLLFAFIGVGLGTVTNRRNVKSGSMVICLGLIVVYWALYVTGENIARKGVIPAWMAIWASNFVFAGLALWSTKRSQS